MPVKATFLRSGNKILKVGGAARTEPAITSGQYTWAANPMDGIHLLRSEPKPYRLPSKVFGDVSVRGDYVFKTWKERNRNTGVLLRGTKGTGKSLFVKELVNKALAENIPVISLNEVFGEDISAQLNLLRSNTDPMVLVCDEAEKVLDFKSQSILLSFLDGTFDGNVLTLLTANDVYKLDQHFINRPGRILFSWNYEGLDESVIRDVVATNLNNKSLVDETAERISQISEVTFDVTTSIVEVMNIHNISVDEALVGLNIEVIHASPYATEETHPNQFQEFMLHLMKGASV